MSWSVRPSRSSSSRSSRSHGLLVPAEHPLHAGQGDDDSDPHAPWLRNGQRGRGTQHVTTLPQSSGRAERGGPLEPQLRLPAAVFTQQPQGFPGPVRGGGRCDGRHVAGRPRQQIRGLLVTRIRRSLHVGGLHGGRGPARRQALRGAAMRTDQPAGARCLVYGGTDKRVAEPELARRSRGPHHVVCAEFVQGCQSARLIGPGDGRDHRGREGISENRRHSCGEPRLDPTDRATPPGASPAPVGACLAPSPTGPTAHGRGKLLGGHPGQRLQVERIPAADLVQLPPAPRPHVAREQARGVRGRQGTQPHPRQPAVRLRPDQGRRQTRRNLPRPVGEREQHRRLRRMPYQVVDQLGGRVVRPVQIVQAEYESPGCHGPWLPVATAPPGGASTARHAPAPPPSRRPTVRGRRHRVGARPHSATRAQDVPAGTRRRDGRPARPRRHRYGAWSNCTLRPASTSSPRCLARSPSSVSSRVLPMPGSPASSTTCARAPVPPAVTSPRTRSNIAASSARPTSRPLRRFRCFGTRPGRSGPCRTGGAVPNPRRGRACRVRCPRRGGSPGEAAAPPFPGRHRVLRPAASARRRNRPGPPDRARPCAGPSSTPRQAARPAGVRRPGRVTGRPPPHDCPRPVRSGPRPPARRRTPASSFPGPWQPRGHVHGSGVLTATR
jgi:hypothetical protein